MIAVQSHAASVAEYQRLLVTDWKKSFPEEVLSLLWTALGESSVTAESDPLIHLLDPNYGASFPVNYYQSVVRRIAEGTKFVRLTALPKMPADYAPVKKLSKNAWLANRLITYLTLPAHTTVAGDMEFFVDVQALAFQAALHFVLPELRARNPAEHAILLHSAMLYSLGYSAYDPAHYAYMMSMIHGYLGDAEQRLRSLYASFRFTAPQDHSYLTKAQEYWTELLDSKRYEEAEQFLFSLHWWALPTQQEEVREMVIAAVKYALLENQIRA